MEMKICRDCGKEKPIELFHWSDKGKGITKSYCNACSVLRAREHVEADPVAYRIYSQQYYRENPEKYPGNYITKSTPRQSGVYKITCLITGDTYVGCSNNLRSRLYKHKRNTGWSVQKDLKKLINLYTWDAFKWEILEICEPEVKFERETFHIQNEKPTLNRAKV